MATTEMSQIKFDYGSLDKAARKIVEQKTAEIRDRFNRAAENIVEIGQRLIEVKAALRHGQFGEWLELEFDWDDSTARKMMQVANTFKSCEIHDLKKIAASPSALYLIAADSTPEEIRSDFKRRIVGGEPVTCAEVKTAIEAAKESFRNRPTYQCDCGETFDAPVWHCKHCDHHWHNEDDECRNCHKSRGRAKVAAEVKGQSVEAHLVTLASEIGEDGDEPTAAEPLIPNGKQYINGDTGEEIENLVTVTTKATTAKRYSISQAKFDEISDALNELSSLAKKSSHQVSMTEVRRIVERAVSVFSSVTRSES